MEVNQKMELINVICFFSFSLALKWSEKCSGEIYWQQRTVNTLLGMLRIMKNELVHSSRAICILMYSGYQPAPGILRIGHFPKKNSENIKK